MQTRRGLNESASPSLLSLIHLMVFPLVVFQLSIRYLFCSFSSLLSAHRSARSTSGILLKVKVHGDPYCATIMQAVSGKAGMVWAGWRGVNAALLMCALVGSCLSAWLMAQGTP